MFDTTIDGEPTAGVDQPSMIWHYTSIDTAMKIVEYGDVRMCDALYLNDRSELRLLTEALVSAAADPRLNDLSAAVADLARSLSNPAAVNPSAYIACFSKREDDLSQWRAYGDGGRGVALGFSRDELAESDLTVTTIDCEYITEDAAREIVVRRSLPAWWTAQGATTGRTSWTTNEWAALAESDPTKIAEAHFHLKTILFNQLLNDSVKYKHAGFADEREVRLADVRNLSDVQDVDGFKKLSVFNGKGGMTPYRTFQYKTALKRITVGPCEPSEARRRVAAWRTYLQGMARRVAVEEDGAGANQEAVNQVEVAPSSIPLRL